MAASHELEKLRVFLSRVMQMLAPYLASIDTGEAADEDGWVTVRIMLRGQGAFRDVRMRMAGEHRGRPMVEIDTPPLVFIEANPIVVAHWITR